MFFAIVSPRLQVSRCAGTGPDHRTSYQQKKNFVASMRCIEGNFFGTAASDQKLAVRRNGSPESRRGVLSQVPQSWRDVLGQVIKVNLLSIAIDPRRIDPKPVVLCPFSPMTGW